jgi:hypothetical protein
MACSFSGKDRCSDRLSVHNDPLKYATEAHGQKILTAETQRTPRKTGFNKINSGQDSEIAIFVNPVNPVKASPCNTYVQFLNLLASISGQALFSLRSLRLCGERPVLFP